MKGLRNDMANKHKAARTLDAHRSKPGGADGSSSGRGDGAGGADSGAAEKCTVLQYKFNMSAQMRAIKDWDSWVTGSPAEFDFTAPLVEMIPHTGPRTRLGLRLRHRAAGLGFG